MSGINTKSLLPAFRQGAAPTMALSGLFQSPERNFYNTETVEIDIERTEEDIAIAITDLSAGTNYNEKNIYTNKEFKAPIFDETFALNSYDALKRMAGRNPFEDPSFRADTIDQMLSYGQDLRKKISRSIELQASQVLQEGKITLTDKNGTELYKLDFKPKVTHFPIAGTAWDEVGATPLLDVLSLSEKNRNDGLEDSDELWMGDLAFESFMNNADVKERYNGRRADLGTISPMKKRGKGQNYRGTVEIGNRHFDIYTYGGRYKDPQTGEKVQYLDPASVIVRSSTARLDATYGWVPNFNEMIGQSLIPELPNRLSDPELGMDMFMTVYKSQDGKQLMGNVACRPLLIPTAIDTYGCINTGVGA